MELGAPVWAIVAAALGLAGFTSGNIAWLRLLTTAALAILSVGLFLSGFPIVAALAALALAANLFRAAQMGRATRDAGTGAISLDHIFRSLKSIKFGDDELLFRKGDPPHYIYFIKSGEVILDEIGVTLGAGELLGEIAFFSDANERTLTARCKGKCEIIVIKESDFARLQDRHPGLGVHVLRLVVSRLLDGLANHPDAYRPYSRVERKRRGDGTDIRP